MPATVVVGAQWGDEGKGKIVDLLAQQADVVCRYQGGPNAGHTIVVGDETFKIRATPSGVISGKVSVIGGGCVVDPEVLIAELDDLESRGIDTSVVVLSGNAHLIMPWHIAIDQASERRLGKLQIGTTRRGIGPCYADKASRIGIRVQDVLDPKILRQKIEVALAEKNVWLERVYEVDGFDLDEVATRYEGYAKRLRPIVGDASLLVSDALDAGKDVLFEGAQATLLDLDHGTYPFVTSSNPIASGAATGIGIGPTRLDRILGVAKAYVTHVGEGPFPSEIEGPDQERLRDLGGEFGTVTGRVRRCGFKLDLVALLYSRPRERDHLPRPDEASSTSSPLSPRYRSASATASATAPRPRTSPHTRATSTTRARSGRRCPAGKSPSKAPPPATSSPKRRGTMSSSSNAQLKVPVELVGVGAGREHVLA